MSRRGGKRRGPGTMVGRPPRRGKAPHDPARHAGRGGAGAPRRPWPVRRRGGPRVMRPARWCASSTPRRSRAGCDTRSSPRPSATSTPSRDTPTSPASTALSRAGRPRPTRSPPCPSLGGCVYRQKKRPAEALGAPPPRDEMHFHRFAVGPVPEGENLHDTILDRPGTGGGQVTPTFHALRHGFATTASAWRMRPSASRSFPAQSDKRAPRRRPGRLPWCKVGARKARKLALRGKRTRLLPGPCA